VCDENRVVRGHARSEAPNRGAEETGPPRMNVSTRIHFYRVSGVRPASRPVPVPVPVPVRNSGYLSITKLEKRKKRKVKPALSNNNIARFAFGTRPRRRVAQELNIRRNGVLRCLSAAWPHRAPPPFSSHLQTELGFAFRAVCCRKNSVDPLVAVSAKDDEQPV
jgi:hypothetical protein